MNIPFPRKQALNPQRQRSKYICKPEAVVEVGNHIVWEFAANYGMHNVPVTTAISQREFIIFISDLGSVHILRHTIISDFVKFNLSEN